MRRATDQKPKNGSPQTHNWALDTLAEVIPGVLYVADASGQLIYESKRGQDWTGVSLNGFGYESIVHPDDLERVIDDLHAGGRTRISGAYD